MPCKRMRPPTSSPRLNSTPERCRSGRVGYRKRSIADGLLEPKFLSSPLVFIDTSLGAMRVKLTNMLSIFAESLGQQASRFEPVVGHGCSPKANLIFPACLGKCLVSNKSSPCISCEEFNHSKSIAARARLLQIQIGASCLCRSRALATKAVQCRLVRLRVHYTMTFAFCS